MKGYHSTRKQAISEGRIRSNSVANRSTQTQSRHKSLRKICEREGSSSISVANIQQQIPCKFRNGFASNLYIVAKASQSCIRIYEFGCLRTRRRSIANPYSQFPRKVCDGFTRKAINSQFPNKFAMGCLGQYVEILLWICESFFYYYYIT